MIDIYIINLLHRTDRKNKIIKSFKKYININLIFIEAVKNDNGAIGCFMSHQKCLEIAKEKNLDYIIVMEDDTIPKPDINFEDELLKTLDFLKTQDSWNIFLGIGNRIEQENIINTYNFNNNTFIKVNATRTTNLVIYNKNCYNFFLDSDPISCIPIDRHWNYKLEAYLKFPFFLETYKSYSDIEKKSTNYNKVFNRTQEIISKHISKK